MASTSIPTIIETIKTLIQEITWETLPDLYMVPLPVNATGDIDVFENRGYGLVLTNESDSSIIWGARKVEFRLILGYPIPRDPVDLSGWQYNDVRQIAHALRTLKVDGIVKADIGAAWEDDALEGKENKFLNVPVYVDYVTPELEAFNG